MSINPNERPCFLAITQDLVCMMGEFEAEGIDLDVPTPIAHDVFDNSARFMPSPSLSPSRSPSTSPSPQTDPSPTLQQERRHTEKPGSSEKRSGAHEEAADSGVYSVRRRLGFTEASAGAAHAPLPASPRLLCDVAYAALASPGEEPTSRRRRREPSTSPPPEPSVAQSPPPPVLPPVTPADAAEAEASHVPTPPPPELSVSRPPLPPAAEPAEPFSEELDLPPLVWRPPPIAPAASAEGQPPSSPPPSPPPPPPSERDTAPLAVELPATPVATGVTGRATGVSTSIATPSAITFNAMRDSTDGVV